MDVVLQALRSRGYQSDGPPFPIGRPDRATVPMRSRAGAPVVAKLYPDGGGEAACLNMQQAWHSSFGGGRERPRLPRPIEYVAEARALLMERVEGRPMAEDDLLDDRLLHEAIRLLAALHESDAWPRKRSNRARIIRSLVQKAEEIAELAPLFGARFREVVETLRAAEGEDRELLPCHGAFAPRNVLVAQDRLVLIDWDRFQRADPGRDLAYMGAWGWFFGLRQHRADDWSVLTRGLAIYRSLRPQSSIEVDLNFHVTAGLVRIAHAVATFWPEESCLLPDLETEALSRVSSAEAVRVR